jgi:hypothetical protein
MNNQVVSALKSACGVALIALAAQSASGAPIVISGLGLEDSSVAGGQLIYRDGGSGDPSVSSVTYAGGAPATVNLYTADSGLDGYAPAAFIKAAAVGQSSLGLLDAFSAHYVLASSSTPAGTDPYWLTYLLDPDGGFVGVISFGGPDLNGSSQVHVFCDYAGSSDCTSDLENTTFGDTLSVLDNLAYAGTTFGQLAVYETAVEIGDWNNGQAVVPASASIQSITLFAVPEPTPLLLLAVGLAVIAAQRRSRRRA